MWFLTPKFALAFQLLIDDEIGETAFYTFDDSQYSEWLISTRLHRYHEIIHFLFLSCFVGIICRPVALSIAYLLFLFYIPFVPLATTKTIRGHAGYYFKLVIAITSIIVLLQIAFQVVLLAEDSEFLKSCEFREMLFRHIGMIKVSKLA